MRTAVLACVWHPGRSALCGRAARRGHFLRLSSRTSLSPVGTQSTCTHTAAPFLTPGQQQSIHGGRGDAPELRPGEAWRSFLVLPGRPSTLPRLLCWSTPARPPPGSGGSGAGHLRVGTCPSCSSWLPSPGASRRVPASSLHEPTRGLRQPRRLGPAVVDTLWPETQALCGLAASRVCVCTCVCVCAARGDRNLFL